jgi:hypothetical protein
MGQAQAFVAIRSEWRCHSLETRSKTIAARDEAEHKKRRALSSAAFCCV